MNLLPKVTHDISIQSQTLLTLCTPKPKPNPASPAILHRCSFSSPPNLHRCSFRSLLLLQFARPNLLLLLQFARPNPPLLLQFSHPNIQGMEEMDASGLEVNQVRAPMSRPGFGRTGKKISLCTNHFRVELNNSAGYFFQYSVSIYNNDGQPVEGKGIGRRIMDKVYETYKFELAGKDFAYDGEKSLFTWGALPKNDVELMVFLDKISSKRYISKSHFNGREIHNQGNGKRQKCIIQTNTFRVVIKYAAKIPAGAIFDMLRGKYSKEVHEVIKGRPYHEAIVLL